MGARLEAWLLRRWYGGVAPGPGLRLLAAVYGGLLRLRAGLYRRGWKRVERLPVPVVVIGNLVAGGSGKTPLTIAVAGWLAAQGRKPGIVSRGYGRQSSGSLRVHADTAAADAGDEPLLIARRTGLPVFVDRDRVAAARRAVAIGCDVILADDGLQHRRLGRDVEIEVIDGERRYGNGRLLPAGPLREPAGRRVDLRVVNGGDAGAGEFAMRLELADAVALADGATRPLPAFAAAPVHALAGIGNPPRFFAALRAAGLQVHEHPFPDHHAFTAADLARAAPGPQLMTEKDAVKCRGLDVAHAWAVPVRAELADSFYAALAARLAEWRPANDRP